MRHEDNARAAQRPGGWLAGPCPVRLIPEGVRTQEKNVALADSLKNNGLPPLSLRRQHQSTKGLVRTGFTDIRRNKTGRAPQRWHLKQGL